MRPFEFRRMGGGRRREWIEVVPGSRSNIHGRQGDPWVAQWWTPWFYGAFRHDECPRWPMPADPHRIDLLLNEVEQLSALQFVSLTEARDIRAHLREAFQSAMG